MSDMPPPPPPAPQPSPSIQSRMPRQRPWLWPAIAVAAMLVAAVAVTALVVGGDTSPSVQPPIAPTTASVPAPPTAPQAVTSILAVSVASTTPVVPSTTVVAAAPDTAPAEVPVVVAPFDAQASIKELAQSRGATDYSKPSEGPCGTFAMLILNNHVEFYLWSGERWEDASLLLGSDGDIDPLTVTSRDYTGDGAVDFLVTYDGAGVGGHNFGGVFSVFDCTWGWVDILTLDGSVTQVLDAMYYDDATGQIYAQDFVDGVGRSPVSLNYDRHSNFFVTEYNG